MKIRLIFCLSTVMLTIQCIGRDFNQYLASNTKYYIETGKRAELVSLCNSTNKQERRIAHALLAFEAVGKAQEDHTFDFTEAKKLAQEAISSSTNDWINIWAGVSLVASYNLQRNHDHLVNATNALVLLQKVNNSVWETSDNPIYSLWSDEKQITADKLRETLSRSIISSFCSLHRFDDAEAFLKKCPDSLWKTESFKNITLQKKEYERSIQEAKEIRLRKEIQKKKQ